MGKLQSQKERRRPIRNLLMKAAPLVAAVSISCSPVVRQTQPRPIVIKKKSTFEELAEALKHKDKDVRVIALDSILLELDEKNERQYDKILGAIMSAKKQIIPEIVDLLNSDNKRHVYQAKHLLSIMKWDAVPELLSRLKRTDSYGEMFPQAWMVLFICHTTPSTRSKKAIESVLRYFVSEYDGSDQFTQEKITKSFRNIQTPHLEAFLKKGTVEGRLRFLTFIRDAGGSVYLIIFQDAARDDPSKKVRDFAKKVVKQFGGGSP